MLQAEVPSWKGAAPSLAVIPERGAMRRELAQLLELRKAGPVRQ
jgi:hypothetical protein